MCSKLKPVYSESIHHPVKMHIYHRNYSSTNEHSVCGTGLMNKLSRGHAHNYFSVLSQSYRPCYLNLSQCTGPSITCKTSGAEISQLHELPCPCTVTEAIILLVDPTEPDTHLNITPEDRNGSSLQTFVFNKAIQWKMSLNKTQPKYHIRHVIPLYICPV